MYIAIKAATKKNKKKTIFVRKKWMDKHFIDRSIDKDNID